MFEINAAIAAKLGVAHHALISPKIAQHALSLPGHPKEHEQNIFAGTADPPYLSGLRLMSHTMRSR